MTRAEFITGWTILITQPWGKTYRGQGPEATIQRELYYKHVSAANPIVWQAICESNAQGERWPTLEALKEGLRANGGYVRADQRAIEVDGLTHWSEPPEPLQAVFAYQCEHDCTVKEAVLAIIPEWLKQNDGHEDHGRASGLLTLARRNFDLPAGKAGNVRVQV